MFNSTQTFIPQLPFGPIQYSPRRWDFGLDRIAGPPELDAFSAQHRAEIAAIEQAAAQRKAASEAAGEANSRAAEVLSRAQQQALEEEVRLRRWRAATAAMQQMGQVPQANAAKPTGLCPIARSALTARACRRSANAIWWCPDSGLPLARRASFCAQNCGILHQRFGFRVRLLCQSCRLISRCFSARICSGVFGLGWGGV